MSQAATPSSPCTNNHTAAGHSRHMLQGQLHDRHRGQLGALSQEQSHMVACKCQVWTPEPCSDDAVLPACPEDTRHCEHGRPAGSSRLHNGGPPVSTCPALPGPVGGWCLACIPDWERAGQGSTMFASPPHRQPIELPAVPTFGTGYRMPPCQGQRGDQGLGVRVLALNPLAL